ncbi:MAG TPA: glutaredoxin [Gammaproteobacteria bacterium]|nr:glutaredoxin [Gammaproteobacteria bacterium]
MIMKGGLYFVVLAFFGTVIYQALDKLVIENPAVKLTEHDQLIMYSITGCEFCEVKRRELRRAEIPYVEHIVDRHPGAGAELQKKLTQAGFSPSEMGFPSFDVKGTFIPNNPPLLQIKKIIGDSTAR